jgi:hypothetical protein
MDIAGRRHGVPTPTRRVTCRHRSETPLLPTAIS